jgi:hypothetical protein
LTATLWRNKDYLLYWRSRASSILGSQVSYIALPLFAKHALRNPAEVALVAQSVGGLLGGLWFAGLTAIGLFSTTPVVAIGLGLGWLVAPALRLALAGRRSPALP